MVKPLPYHAYDQYGSLRVSLPLGVMMWFASRSALWVVLAYFPGLSGTTDITFIRSMLTPLAVIASIPALLLLGAGLFRHPDAGPLPRLLWRYGRSLLAVSLLLHMIHLAPPTLISTLTLPPWREADLLVWGELLLHLLLLIYLLYSAPIRAIFADFPQPAIKQPLATTPPLPVSPTVSSSPYLLTAEQILATIRRAAQLAYPNHPQQQQETIHRLLANDRQSAAIWHQLAHLAWRQNRLHEARILFDYAITLDRDHPLYTRDLNDLNASEQP